MIELNVVNPHCMLPVSVSVDWREGVLRKGEGGEDMGGRSRCRGVARVRAEFGGVNVTIWNFSWRYAETVTLSCFDASTSSWLLNSKLSCLTVLVWKNTNEFLGPIRRLVCFMLWSKRCVRCWGRDRRALRRALTVLMATGSAGGPSRRISRSSVSNNDQNDGSEVGR